MKITDLSPENENLYFCCLEDWSDEMKESGELKQRWYQHMKDKGLRVKLCVDENGVVGGMIQYVPVEYSMYKGDNLYVVLCIWVHGYKQGRGNFRNRGMGIALIRAAEEDCREMGAGGLVTWGLIIPVFMRASWFKRHGYKVADKSGIMRLMWKQFDAAAHPPEFIKKKKYPGKGADRVNVSVIRSGWCPGQNIAFERARRASAEFPGKIDWHEYDTNDRKTFEEWGILDGLYIEGKEVTIGPPASYRKIRSKIARKVK